jgi:RNA polymerase sigma-70 factor (ECF subfamily)
MLEDKLLTWRFKHGSAGALSCIYEKYVNSLLTLAMALVHDKATAEDIVHDVFVSLAERVDGFQLKGNLKSFLNTCVLNRSRDVLKLAKGRQVLLKASVTWKQGDATPQTIGEANEQNQCIRRAMAQLPLEQKEIVALHLGANMRFTQIAALQRISVNTVRGRYRYGLQKLRNLLNGEVDS